MTGVFVLNLSADAYKADVVMLRIALKPLEGSTEVEAYQVARALSF